MKKLALAGLALSAAGLVGMAAPAEATIRYCNQNLPADVSCVSQPHGMYCDVLVGHKCINVNRPLDTVS